MTTLALAAHLTPKHTAALCRRAGITEAQWGKLVTYMLKAGWASCVGASEAVEAPVAPPPAPKAPPADPAGFTRFWAAWPRSPHKSGKGAARAKWKSKRCEPMTERILAAVEANKRGNEQWRKDDGQWIPMPATWLNQERWDDEIGKVEAQSAMTSTAQRTLEHLRGMEKLRAMGANVEEA